MPGYFLPKMANSDAAQLILLRSDAEFKIQNDTHKQNAYLVLTHFARLENLSLTEVQSNAEFMKELFIFLREQAPTEEACHELIQAITLSEKNKDELSKNPKLLRIHAAVMKLNEPQKRSEVVTPSSQSTVRALASQLELKQQSQPQKFYTFLDTLNGQGYWDNSELYYPQDIARALEGYTGTHHSPRFGSLAVINGTRYEWHHGGVGRERELLTEAIKGAIKNNNRVLIPINNGSSHFVFIDIKKENDGSVSVLLKDSMGRVSKGHDENNQTLALLVQNVIKDALELRIGQVKAHIQYTEEQGANAKCPYYAVREVVKVFKELDIAPVKKNDELIAAVDADLKKFEIAMAKKVIRLSDWTKPQFKSELLDRDVLGNLYTKEAKNIPGSHYNQIFRNRSHRAFVMDLATYQGIHALWSKCKTHLESKQDPQLEAWLRQADAGYAEHGVFSPATMIKAVMQGSPLPAFFKENEAGKINLYKTKIATQFCPGRDEYFVDDVQADDMGQMSWETFVLRAFVASLKVEGQQVTLQLFRPGPLFSWSKVQLEALQKLITARLELFGSPLLLMTPVNLSNDGGSLSLTFKDTRSRDPFPALEHLVYNANTNPDGLFGPHVHIAIQEEIKKQNREAKLPTRSLEPIESVVFNVVQHGRVTSRSQVISSPRAAPAPLAMPIIPPSPREEKKAAFDLQRARLERGRVELQRWLGTETPAPFVAGEGKSETPSTLLELKENEVALKQYYYTRADPQKDPGVLTQCGVLETCIKPGEETKLELILPAKKKLIRANGEGKWLNFNILLFEFIHRAVNEAILEQNRANPNRKEPPVIILNQVTSIHLRLPPSQQALMLYCYFKGYSCETSKGERLDNARLGEILRSGTQLGDKVDFETCYSNFAKYIDRPEMTEKFVWPEPPQPSPRHLLPPSPQ